jgi:monovalent cation:proton antiporter-2 (CPA2) family protein
MDKSFLFKAFIFLIAACVVVPLASRFRLGSVLGYLIAGMLIGPFGIAGMIGDPSKIMHFAEFGVVMMLFMIGMELEPATLWRMRKAIVGLGGLQVLGSAALITLIGTLLGYDPRASLAVGFALALSSTALVFQLLRENNLMQTPVSEKSFAVLLFQDIAVIPILVFMPLLAIHQSDAAAHHQTHLLADLPGWAQTLAMAAVIGMVVLVGRYVSHHFFTMIAKTNLREVFTATSLALVVGVTLLMQAVGMSPALGAFVAGMVLANSPYKRTLETDIEPFKGLLLGLFFISVGMSMDFSLMAAQPLNMLGAVAGLVAIKILVLALLGRIFGLSNAHDIGLALVLSQGGEFAFVLLQYANGLSVIESDAAKFFTMVVALSMATTPLLMLAYNRLIIPHFMSILPTRDYDDVHAQKPVILAGFGRFGQVIGRFLIGQGIGVTVLEKDPEQIETIRKFGFTGYFGDATRLDLLRNAGAETAKLLVIAVDDADTALEIVHMAKQEFPNLTIYARARNRRHAYDLHKAGVAYFKRETFDSSLTMAQEIMVFLGKRESDMQYKAQQFLRHDEATLRKSFAFFDNEPELVNFARLRRAEMEQILREDVTDRQED